jgi:pre-mRNA-splicing factor ISY1
MSRNSEKAQSMLYRFREQQAAEMGIIDAGRTRRPKNISGVESVSMAEKWRGQVVREIGRKVTKIQDPAISEHQIRDLNDEINKLMREKYVWELRIKDLGGPNYLRSGSSRMYDGLGRELPNSRGYKYFGRARDLPGVKEIFEAHALQQHQQREQRQSKKGDDQDSMPKQILTAKYFGLEDDLDEELLQEEKNYERPVTMSIHYGDIEPIESLGLVPSVQDIEKYLVDRKRQQLEEQYL